MTTLLINASIIWICSLLVYELLLKRETFHRLNRLYLLLTFAAGITLPLLPWGPDIRVTQIKTTMTGVPLVSANPVPQTVETADKAPALPEQWPAWWQNLYFAGVAISILFLLRELWRLWSLYRKAAVTRAGRWLIAETGVPHNPFSFLHILFVCSREQYTEQQWQMLVRHEQEHYHQRHILDLILMQLAQLLLWFHPLVYIYRHKLCLLHEYEVDSLQEEDVQIYGHFLLEQAALKPAPGFAHSFNYSPLKNRIYMMTRNMSARKAKYRLLLLLPMMAGFIYCCAQNKAAVQVDIEKAGMYYYTVLQKGTKLEYEKMEPSVPDTVYVENPASGERQIVVTRKEPSLERVNGLKLIPVNQLLQVPTCTQLGTRLSMNYLISAAGLEPILAKMSDGNYRIGLNRILIDASGKVISYEVAFPYKQGNGSFSTDLGGIAGEQDKETLNRKLAEVLIGGHITFTPGADKSGSNGPYYLGKYNLQEKRDYMDLSSYFTVKDHKVVYTE